MCLVGFSGCKAEPPKTPRKAIPEAAIPLPEFFGFYAVENGQVKSLQSLRTNAAGNAGSSVEFLLFDDEAAKKASKMEISRLEFDPWEIMISPTPHWNENYVDDGRKDLNLIDPPKGFKAQPSFEEIELLRKPVSNHLDMIRLVPASKLPPGFYVLGYGEKPEEAFAFWVERDKLNAEIANQRKQIKAAFADPKLPVRQKALALVDDLRALRRAMDEVSREQNMPKGASIPTSRLIQKYPFEERSLPLRDPLGNEYSDFVVGSFPTVSTRTMEALRELPLKQELRSLLYQPTEMSSRKGGFYGLALVCPNCNQLISKRDRKFEVKASEVLPLTFYISSLECPNCGETVAPERAYLHGM